MKKHSSSIGAPPRNILVMRPGSGGIKPLCDALKIAGLRRDEHFSASTDERIIAEWVPDTEKRQLLIIDPGNDTKLTPLIAGLKKKNPLLSVTVIGTCNGSSAHIDSFIDADANNRHSLGLMIDIDRGFNRPQAAPPPERAD